MATFRLINGHPTYVLGRGDTSLVVIPGLGDAFQTPHNSALARFLLKNYYYRPYLDDYRLYVISRPRDLTPDTTTQEMANDYATVIDRLGGPVHVVGLSMGGLIGLHLAATHPASLDRFVCAVAGVRCSDRGREIITRWRKLAEAGDIFDIYFDSIPVTYGNGLRSRVYSSFLGTVGRYLMPPPANPQDIIVQVQACLDHDASGVLADIDTPTLIVGGDGDPIFPPEILRETAAGIGNSRLEILANTAHGAFEQRKRTFDGLVAAFLDPESNATL